jgi:methylated-DNA-[protein]-cysteine S-methyltransferase
MTEFSKAVFDLVRTIPKGKVMTYKEVAEAIGRPKSFRAVGNTLNKNYDPEVPCHRVVRSDGGIGGYNRGANLKRERLINEQAISS